jgi:hypothetical protein
MKLINSIQILALTILTSSLSFAQTSPTGTAPTVGTTTNAKGNTTTTTQTTGGGTNKVTNDFTSTTQKNGTTVTTSKTVDPVTGKTTFTKNVSNDEGKLESSSKTITTPTKSK